LFFRLLFIFLGLFPSFREHLREPQSHPLLNPELREKGDSSFHKMPHTARPPVRQSLPKILHFDLPGRKLF
jgi:hypothetical protein